MLFETKTAPLAPPTSPPPRTAEMIPSPPRPNFLPPAAKPAFAVTPLLSGAVLGLLVITWAFFSTLDMLVEVWTSDPQYSHGFLVPLFSLYLLYRNWDAGSLKAGPSLPVLGIVMFALALGIRVVAGGLLFVQLDALALLVSLVGLALLLGGTRLLKSTATAIIFLIFMVHLPYELQKNVGGPLKLFATQASTFLLQTLGYPAVAEGNVILIDEVTLGVIDACSGLKMLVTFSAFAVGAIMILDRTWFEKVLILLGILPIAVITNVLRITATGIFHTLNSDKQQQTLAHDIFGYLMMPAGLGLLGLQLMILSRLVVRPTTRPMS